MSILKGFYQGIKPIPITTVSEWADRSRYLTSDSAAEPGRWRTMRTPYLKEILDNLSPNSPINEVIAQKGVQLGFTEAALNVVGCYVDLAPCPIMYVMPTIEVAKGFSESRVDPMISCCPSLKEKIRPPRERDSGNTKFTKKFPGGLLVISGSNSAASLRSRPIRVLLLDEVDAYPLDVDGEGSPISLAEKRQSTFGLKRKRYKLSTPTMEHTSVIEPEYLKTDQRKYYVPCPHCGCTQELKFEQLRWNAHDYEKVYYECVEPQCKALIHERFKTKMLEAGSWVVTCPANLSPTKRGYHLNSLYSPIGWLSWADIAKEFDEAEHDENKMKTFVNTILGETWKVKGEVPDWKNLYNRRERYEFNKPSKDVVFITVGVDVQGDRLELQVMGWGRGRRMYSLDYRVIPGQTSTKEPWDRLADVVSETWEREDGLILPMRLMAVDTGYNTQFCYDFCRRFDPTQVIPIKGQDEQRIMVVPPRQVDVNSVGKKIGRVKVWNVGVSMIKSEIYGRLKLEITDGVVPPNYIHFPEYDEKFFRGITAEVLQVTTTKRGFKSYAWVKKYPENEPLDTTVYARAAAAVIGIDRMEEKNFLKIEASYLKVSKPTPQQDKPRFTKRPSIWD